MSEGDKDMFLCCEWAFLCLLNGRLPTEEQFLAMQRKGFLPLTHAGGWAVEYGYPGWKFDYDWPGIAAKILATVVLL